VHSLPSGWALIGWKELAKGSRNWISKEPPSSAKRLKAPKEFEFNQLQKKALGQGRKVRYFNFGWAPFWLFSINQAFFLIIFNILWEIFLYGYGGETTFHLWLVKF